MKEMYEKPELESKAFAQFESVFTACNKNPAPDNDCIWSGAINEPGSHNCHHDITGGS